MDLLVCGDEKADEAVEDGWLCPQSPTRAEINEALLPWEYNFNNWCLYATCLWTRRNGRGKVLIYIFTKNCFSYEFREVVAPLKFKMTEWKIYFVVKKADGTLDQALRTANQNNTKFDEETIQFLVYQMVRALKHIHSANVMHRDLKPDNIGVLEEDGIIQILDFG